MPKYRACMTVGCGAYAEPKAYTCKRHHPPQVAWVKRERTTHAGPSPYANARWRKLRLMVLREHPLCASCEAPAVEVDHIVPLSKGGTMYDQANLQGLCKRCHAAKSGSGE